MDCSWWGAVTGGLSVFAEKYVGREETNIEVGELQYLCDLVFVRPDGVPVVVLSYFGPWKLGKVKLGDEMLVEFVWATPKEAKKYDLIDGILEEIEVVDLILKGKKTARLGRETLFNDLLLRNRHKFNGNLNHRKPAG